MPQILKTMGREKRLEYAASFENCYFFRLLYYAGTQYPIMGALRLAPRNLSSFVLDKSQVTCSMYLVITLEGFFFFSVNIDNNTSLAEVKTKGKCHIL